VKDRPLSKTADHPTQTPQKKCKVTVHALKAYRGSKGTAPLILNLGTRRTCGYHLPLALSPAKNPGIHCVGHCVGVNCWLDPAGIRAPVRPACAVLRLGLIWRHQNSVIGFRLRVSLNVAASYLTLFLPNWEVRMWSFIINETFCDFR